MMSPIRNLALSLLITGLTASPGLAQGSTTGNIAGEIRDESGAAMPGVTVTATHVATGLVRTVVADTQGHYELLQLPIGRYELAAELRGFRLEKAQADVAVQSHVRINLTMHVGALSVELTVEGAAPLVNTRDASLSGVVDNKKVSELPLNGRSFTDLMTLQPGATPVLSTGGGRTSDTRNAGGFINGADSFFNNFTVDGGDYNDFVVPGSNINKALIGTGLSPDAIEEFRIITSNADAEFGTVAGAQINVVTKSGTNTIAGTGWEFLRNDKFDARNFFDRGAYFNDKNGDGRFTPGVDTAKPPPFERHQFGFSLGGPIRKNKDFIFGSYEGYRQDLLRTATPLVPTPRLLAAIPGGPENGNLRELYEAFFPDPDPGYAPDALIAPLSATVNVGNDRNAFMVRTDHHLSARDRVSFRVIFNQALGLPGSILSSAIPGGNLGFNWRNIDPQVTYTRLFSSALVNEFRVNYNRHRLGVSWDEPPEAVTRLGFSANAADRNGLPFVVAAGTGLSNMGVFTGVPQGRVAHAYQVNDTLSWARGRHSLKFGGNLIRYQLDGFGPDTPRRQTVFIGFGPPFDTSPFGLTTGTFFNQTQTFNLDPVDSGRRHRRYTHTGLFVQDDFRVRPNLNINLGLRWEYTSPAVEQFDIQNNIYPVDASGQAVLGPILDVRSIGLFPADGETRPLFKKDWNDFGPRVGFAWDPLTNARMVLRGGYGRFYNRPELFFVGGTGNFPFSLPTTITAAGFGTVADPQQFLGRPQNVSGINPDYTTTNYDKFNVTAAFNIGWQTMAQVSYVGTRGHNLFRNRLPNLGAGFSGPRPNPAFAVVAFEETSGRSRYDALQIEANRRFTQGVGFQVSYTYSQARDTQPLGANATDQADLDADYGPADYDVPHILVVNYFWELPIGSGKRWLNDGLLGRVLGDWTTSAIVAYTTGSTFSILSGVDSNGDGTNNDYARLAAGADPGAIYAQGGDKTQSLVPRSQALSLLSATQGTLLGRNAFHGPNQFNVDFSLVKSVTLGGKRRLQIRSEVFNLLNHTNFDLPVASIGSGAFGQIFATRGNSRQIQFGLRAIF